MVKRPKYLPLVPHVVGELPIILVENKDSGAFIDNNLIVAIKKLRD
jgi:hypothetical protein